MKLFKSLRQQLFQNPHDERIDHVRGRAGWKAFLAMFLGYIIITIVLAVKNTPVPLSTQMLFYFSFLVFFMSNLRENGFQFVIPGFKETDETLDDPAAMRSVPWLMIAAGIVSAVFSNLISTIATFAQWEVEMENKFLAVSISILVACVATLTSILFTTYTAYRLKRGDKLFMVIALGMSVMGMIHFFTQSFTIHFIGVSLLGKQFDTLTPAFFAQSGVRFFLLAAHMWILCNLLNYWPRYIQSGKSYANLPAIQATKEQRMRRWVIALAIGIPVTLYVLSSINSVYLKKFDQVLDQRYCYDAGIKDGKPSTISISCDEE